MRVLRTTQVPALPQSETIYFVPDAANANNVRQYIVGDDAQLREVQPPEVDGLDELTDLSLTFENALL